MSIKDKISRTLFKIEKLFKGFVEFQVTHNITQFKFIIASKIFKKQILFYANNQFNYC